MFTSRVSSRPHLTRRNVAGSVAGNVAGKVASALGAVALTFAVAAGTAHAAESTPSGVVIAQGVSDTSNPASSRTRVELTAMPTKPGAITVSAPAQSTITTVVGKNKVTKKANAQGKAVFTNLTPGKDYTFTSGKKSVRATALTTTAPVSKLTVLTTKTPDSVAVSWDHQSSRSTGGADTTYSITAEPNNSNTKIGSSANTTNSTNESITETTTNNAVVLNGLNPDALYHFTVTPINAIGPGPATTATMSVSLRSLAISDQPAAREIKPAPTQTITPATNANTNSNPTPAPQPGTRTIYVCPATYTEVRGVCQKTREYTYSYLPYSYHSVTTNLPYTYHTVQTGPAPILESYETFTNSCPSGYNMEDYGVNGKWCRLYGAPPTAQVKDAPPAGYTDNGANYTKTEQVKDSTPGGYVDTGRQWEKKDAAPAGYSDDGTQYIATTDKIAKEIPA